MPFDIGAQQERRTAIRDILGVETISTQQGLLRRLRERGFDVTQPSVSRDLKEMGVARVGGRYRWLGETATAEPAPGLTSVAAFIGAVQAAGPNLLVVRTPPGLAASVALALDKVGWPEVVGTVAGDDTFFVAVSGRRDRQRVEAKLVATRSAVHHG